MDYNPKKRIKMIEEGHEPEPKFNIEPDIEPEFQLFSYSPELDRRIMQYLTQEKRSVEDTKQIVEYIANEMEIERLEKERKKQRDNNNPYRFHFGPENDSLDSKI